MCGCPIAYASLWLSCGTSGPPRGMQRETSVNTQGEKRTLAQVTYASDINIRVACFALLSGSYRVSYRICGSIILQYETSLVDALYNISAAWSHLISSVADPTFGQRRTLPAPYAITTSQLLLLQGVINVLEGPTRPSKWFTMYQKSATNFLPYLSQKTIQQVSRGEPHRSCSLHKSLDHSSFLWRPVATEIQKMFKEFETPTAL
jgi:hypothetical protein